MASPLQRSTGTLARSTFGARIAAVGSSAAISTSSSFSSCLLLDAARVAVLARALFLAMNSSSCFIFESVALFVRGRVRAVLLIFRNASILPGYIVSLPRERSSVESQFAPKNARSCETIKHASL